MAVDKAVDSSQLDADLTSVANAIRTKGGTSASLAFPADFVSAIEAISGGGGGKTIYSGSFTLATKTLSQSVTVGTDPISFVACFATTSPWTSTGRTFGAGMYDVETNRHPVVASNSSGSSAAGNINGGFSISQSGTTLTMTTSNSSSSGYFVVDITYKWYAW